MDPWLSVRLLTVCLFGAAPSCRGGSIECLCPDIPRRDLTKPPSRECRQIDSTYRYICVDGYVRKAGTSNRIKCEQNNGRIHWSSTTLECIEDPKKPRTQTENATETKSHTEPSRDPIRTTTPSVTKHVSSVILVSAAAPTSPLTIQDISSSPSKAAGTSMKIPSYDPVPTLKSSTLETTTVSKDYTNSSPEAQIGPGKVAVISISVVGVVVIVLIIIVFLLYSRLNTTSEPPMEEQVPMNQQ